MKFIWRGSLLSALCLLQACVTTPEEPAPPGKPQVRYEPVSWTKVDGWNEDRVEEAWIAFERSCKAIGTRPEWQGVCDTSRSSTAPRSFFETNFTPYRVVGPNGPEGLFTGYYEPTLDASRTRRAGFDAPIYALPPEATHGAVLAARAEIENGTAAKGWRVLFWARDPVDVFTLHVQGSGRIVLEDGSLMRVGFSAQNGHPYYAIGRELVARGALTREQVSMQSIRAWLVANSCTSDACARIGGDSAATAYTAAAANRHNQKARDVSAPRKDSSIENVHRSNRPARSNRIPRRPHIRHSRPPYWASSPSSSSIRSNWLYLQTRSVRLAEPVLICPVASATERSAIVVSSVSPERWLITAV